MGSTEKSFKVRSMEHGKTVVDRKIRSNDAKHLIEGKHSFKGIFEILHFEKKGQTLNSFDTLEINRLKHSRVLLNDQLERNHSPFSNLLSNTG